MVASFIYATVVVEAQRLQWSLRTLFDLVRLMGGRRGVPQSGGLVC